MKRWGGLMLMLVLCAVRLSAQQDVLVVINGEKFTCAEYRDFCVRKGMSAQTVDTFIDYKLKANAARHIGLDTLSSFRSFMDSCRHGLSSFFLMEQNGSSVYGARLKKPLVSSRVLVSHLFQYIPQNVTANRLRACETRMDSLHDAICSGRIKFEEAVKMYSQEKDSFWISTLDMPVEFEQVAFALPEGQVSAPFFTPQGIHIIKVLLRKSFPLKSHSEWRGRSGGGHVMKNVLDSLKREYHFLPDEAGVSDFLANGFTEKNLFSLNGKLYSGEDIASFVQSYPASPTRQLDGFIAKTVLSYADLQLVKTCPDYNLRLRAYADSLLCQSITERVLGARLQTDTAGVKDYFNRNRKDYRWPETRYEGIVLHCTSKRVGRKVKKFLKKIPADEWQDAIRLGVNAEEQVVAQVEQGLFVPGENRYVDDVVFKKSEALPLTGFPYVLVLGEKKKGPECWDEVGNRLWNDYRNYREFCWIEDLRSKAKVEINQEALKTVNIH